MSTNPGLSPTEEASAFQHPSQSRAQRFPDDDLLRDRGFTVACRPRMGATIWERKGRRYTFAEAVEIAREERARALKALEEEHGKPKQIGMAVAIILLLSWGAGAWAQAPSVTETVGNPYAAYAVVEISVPMGVGPGGGRQFEEGSGTVIETGPGRTLILSAAHLWCRPARFGQVRDERLLRQTIHLWCPTPTPQQGRPGAGVRVIALDPPNDLALLELNDGPLPYVCPVAPAGWRPGGKWLLSVGYDEGRKPAQQRWAHVVADDGARFFTAEKPWHGRSGGALVDTQGGYLVGVVSGYEDPYESPRTRGIYVSLAAVQRFLGRRGAGTGADVSRNRLRPAPSYAPAPAWPVIPQYAPACPT